MEVTPRALVLLTVLGIKHPITHGPDGEKNPPPQKKKKVQEDVRNPRRQKQKKQKKKTENIKHRLGHNLPHVNTESLLKQRP